MNIMSKNDFHVKNEETDWVEGGLSFSFFVYTHTHTHAHTHVHTHTHIYIYKLYPILVQEKAGIEGETLRFA